MRFEICPKVSIPPPNSYPLSQLMLNECLPYWLYIWMLAENKIEQVRQLEYSESPSMGK